MVRYADDFAVFCVDLNTATLAAADVDTALRAHRLRINPSKTYVSTFDAGFSFLGWVFHGDGGWEESPTAGWTHPMSVGRVANSSSPSGPSSPANVAGPSRPGADWPTRFAARSDRDTRLPGGNSWRPSWR